MPRRVSEQQEVARILLSVIRGQDNRNISNEFRSLLFGVQRQLTKYQEIIMRDGRPKKR